MIAVRCSDDEEGSTLIEVLIAALLGVLVMILVSTLMFNTQTYVNRQVAGSQILASAAASLNTVVDSLDNAQLLGYCSSANVDNQYTTPANQCPHISEMGASLWAATPQGACWFAYQTATSNGAITNPSLGGQAPDLQCMYEVPYTHVSDPHYPPPQDQYDLWVVSWPAQGSSATYTSCQLTYGQSESGCWSQSGLSIGDVPTSAPVCTGTNYDTASCPAQQQLIARIYDPTQSAFTYWDAGGCQLGVTTPAKGCTAVAMPSTTSCSSTQEPPTSTPWSGCLASLEQVTSVRLDMHLRAASVNGNYGTGQSGPHSKTPPALGTVDQQLQLTATLFGQSYFQQQQAVAS